MFGNFIFNSNYLGLHFYVYTPCASGASFTYVFFEFEWYGTPLLLVITLTFSYSIYYSIYGVKFCLRQDEAKQAGQALRSLFSSIVHAKFCFASFSVSLVYSQLPLSSFFSFFLL